MKIFSKDIKENELLSKRKLILAGGGSGKDSETLDRLLVTLIPKGGKMLYIPIAMENKSYEKCYEWIKSIFSAFDFKDITMMTSLSRKSCDKIKEFDVVYIGGGNTFKLLYQVKKGHFDKILRHFIASGKVVYGGSAGAIILGKSILTSNDENKVDLKNFLGIDVLDGHSIWCHYEETQDEKIFEFIKKINTPVIALTEMSGVFVNGNKIRAIGFKPVFLFNSEGKFSFKPDSVVYLK